MYFFFLLVSCNSPVFVHVSIYWQVFNERTSTYIKWCNGFWVCFFLFLHFASDQFQYTMQSPIKPNSLPLKSISFSSSKPCISLSFCSFRICLWKALFYSRGFTTICSIWNKCAVEISSRDAINLWYSFVLLLFIFVSLLWEKKRMKKQTFDPLFWPVYPKFSCIQRNSGVHC